ncbi:MAG: glycosyltransferase [Balneolaceae bacterium]|nr:MAG: glycosyltransferase [Balneolaceae bacterium]
MFPEERAVIIFIKNPEKGKVKTRLAKEMGEEKALEIYIRLLRMTIKNTSGVRNAHLQAWYSDFADPDDFIDPSLFKKRVQCGGGLGERMRNAFKTVFEEGYTKAVIIGSDCPYLTSVLIENAFTALEKHTLVVGPALDGGYYLLGMKQLHEELFRDMPWSTRGVLKATLKRAERSGYSVALLPELGDIDTKEDLERWGGYAE